MPETPLTSIIILAFNGMKHLPECLETVTDQSSPDNEIIVVDNGSTDGSPDWVAECYPGVRLIRSRKNRGYCGGMNLGIQHATGRYVFLLNQDIALDPRCVSEMEQAMNDAPENTLGGFPKVLFYDMPDFINSFGVNWYENCHWRDARVGLPDLGQYKSPEFVFGSIFPAVMFKRRGFLEIGGFDPVFWSYCEDFDICYRANILGFRLLAIPGAVMKHKYRASSKDKSDPLWSRYWFVRNYLLVFLKNYEWKNLVKYRYIISMRYMGHAFRQAWQARRRREVLTYLKVMFSLLINSPRIIRNRRWIQKNRKLPDEAVWKIGLVEEFNIYHVDGNIVLSLNAMRAALDGEEYTYPIHDREYRSV